MEWVEPWYSIAGNEKLTLELELARELTAGHPLYGAPVSALGRRLDCDDVLFGLTDGTGRVALVHLTWSAGEKPPWPWTDIYPSIDAWAATPCD
jgi:hypothetical protein